MQILALRMLYVNTFSTQSNVPNLYEVAEEESNMAEIFEVTQVRCF